MFAAKRECIIIILLSFETILRLAFAAEREHKHLIRGSWSWDFGAHEPCGRWGLRNVIGGLWITASNKSNAVP